MSRTEIEKRIHADNERRTRAEISEARYRDFVSGNAIAKIFAAQEKNRVSA